jgi:hypothetical protein
MTITTWIRSSQLSELLSFLKDPWPRRHQVMLYDLPLIQSFPVTQLNLTMEEYQLIKDWQEEV